MVKKRSNMKPEDRRNQILKVAENLFFSKGFEDTTISEIISEAGLSKGGFYHHFASKEELLLGIFAQMVDRIAEPMTATVADKSRSALDRLQSIYDLQGAMIKATGAKAVTLTHIQFYKDSNAQFLAQFINSVADASIPFMTELIEDGQAEGVFTANDAFATATFITFINSSYGRTLADAINARGTDKAEKAKADLKALLEVQFQATNLVLGLPEGTIKFGYLEFVDDIMAVPVADE